VNHVIMDQLCMRTIVNIAMAHATFVVNNT